MSQPHLVYLSLGSNINRESNLRACFEALTENYGELKLSSVFESESIGFQGDPFFNLVVGLKTSQSVAHLSAALRQIEFDNGRDRREEKFSGRTLDIDILLFDDLCGNFDGVQLPRSEIKDNAYVLWPLAEIAGELVLPGTQLRISALWNAYDKTKQQLHPVKFNWNG